MARHRSSQLNRRVGLGATTVAVSAVPLVAVPAARAEVLDDVISQLLTPFLDAAAASPPDAPIDLSASFEQLIYTPLHTGVQAWIDSDPSP